MVQREDHNAEASSLVERCASYARTQVERPHEPATRLRTLLQVMKGVKLEWQDFPCTDAPSRNCVASFFRELKRENRDPSIADDETLPSSLRFKHMSDEERAFHWARVLENRGLAWSVVRNYRTSRCVELDDLAQEALISMVYSSVRYVPGRSKYSTFSTYGSRQAATRFAENHWFAFYVPTHVAQRLNAYIRLKSKISFDSTEEAVLAFSRESGLPLEKALSVAHLAEVRMVSIATRDGTYAEERGQLSSDWATQPEVSYELVDNSVQCIEDEFDKVILKDAVAKVLSRLDDRSRDIIEARFGLGSYKHPQTLEEIGDRYELTRERIRQIEGKALEKLTKNPVFRRLAGELFG